MTGTPFGPGALAFVSAYFLLIVVLGLAARRRRQGNDLADFYLANRNVGAIFLLLTLYATQYSGNSLIGYPGEAYRIGYPWIMSVGFMMAFLPLVTMLPVCLVGILAIPQLQDLHGISADRVLPELMRIWAGQSLFLYAMTIVVLTGAIAAIMSTADSMLLSLSSIVAKDLLGKSVMKLASPERLTVLGKRISWLVMLGLIGVAFEPRISLWGLTELKLEILLQAAPLFLLGTAWNRFTARGALAGLTVGVLLAGGLTLSGLGRVWDIHAGVLALGVNVTIGAAVSLLLPDQRPGKSD